MNWHEEFFQCMDDEALFRASINPVNYMPMVRRPVATHPSHSPPYCTGYY